MMSTDAAQASAPPTRQAAQARRAVISSLVGTSIEWYEFLVYGTAAATYLGPAFFPSDDAFIGRLSAFASFGVAFIARPLGAIVFGHMGDRLGRKSTLIITLVTMGCMTGVVGLLPSYAQIGVAAPIILVICRLFQGLSAGGEWGGATTVAIENAPQHKVRLYGSAPQLGVPIGLVTATGAMFLVSLTPEAFRNSIGWRLPFLLGFALVIVGLVIRLRVAESDDFQATKEEGKTTTLPVGKVFAHTKLPLLVAVGLLAIPNMIFYIGGTYFVSYAENSIGIPSGTALLLVMVAAVADFIFQPIFGRMADKYGVLSLFGFGSIWTIIFAFPFFALVNSGSIPLMLIALLLIFVGGHATTYALVSSMTNELFPTEYRYSGAALAYGIGSLLWSAPVPFLAELLVGTTHAWWPVALMILASGIITAVSWWGYRKLSHRYYSVGVVA